MTDRPIIFSAPMVRALLDGRKTQTRRVLNPRNSIIRDRSDAADCVRFFVGDHLWVRETWSAIMDGGWTIADARRRLFNEKIVYRADGNGYEDGDGWWPSIHMPREFSRLTLTVSDVRVQRLQDISEADARAEGADALRAENGPPEVDEVQSHVWGFQNLWNSLHGTDAWDANPWVVALTFTVQRGNIDAVRP